MNHNDFIETNETIYNNYVQVFDDYEEENLCKDEHSNKKDQAIKFEDDCMNNKWDKINSYILNTINSFTISYKEYFPSVKNLDEFKEEEI